MSGSIELDPGGEHLLIRFPYREDLVEEVRTMPGRRWDRGRKVWRVPAAQVELVYKTFTKHFFHFAPEVSGLLAGTVAPVKKQKGQGHLRLVADNGEDEVETSPESVSVSALNERVRQTLRDAFAEPLWLVGEVVGYDRARKGSHLFFTLAEKREGESRAAATVDAVLYEETASWLLPELEKGDQPMTLQDGIGIRALVRVDLYAPGGRYQVVIDRIDPSFTLGKMALDREKILLELRKAGLDRKNAELRLPVPALRIGVLTSPDADGWTDFHRQLEESGIGFRLALFPTRVQGPQLKPTMLAGLRWFAEHSSEFDALCILRGGGSRTDLAWFDDLELAVAVAKHPLKVLCGIGHQRDQSVLDLIAHSEKTPTALGGFLVGEVRAAEAALAALVDRLEDSVRESLESGRAALARCARQLRDRAGRRLLRERSAVAARGRALQAHTLLLLERAGSVLQRGSLRLRTGVATRLERAGSRLQGQRDRLRLLDPTAVLARGYALMRGEDGRLVVDAKRIRRGDRLHIRMRDGNVVGRAEEVELD